MTNTEIFENWFEQNQNHLKEKHISFSLKKTNLYNKDDWASACEFETAKLIGILVTWDKINFCDVHVLAKDSSKELVIEANEFKESSELVDILENTFQKIVSIESD